MSSLTKEQKEKILYELTTNEIDTDITITNPIVLVDSGDDPWIIDCVVFDKFYIEQNRRWSFIDLPSSDPLFRCITNVDNIPMEHDKEPSFVSEEEEPEFIEQVRLALMMNHL